MCSGPRLPTPSSPAIARASGLVEEHDIVAVPGEGFYGGPANAVRLPLVATPWSEGAEEWLAAVRALKKALEGRV